MSYTAKEVESYYLVASHLELQARKCMEAADLVHSIADKMAENMIKDEPPPSGAGEQ